MDEVQKLEAQLEKAKSAKRDKEWESVVSQYKRLGKWLTGKDIIQFSTKHSWSVTRITGFEEQYDTSSGFYGQWDKRRYLCLAGTRLLMQVDSHTIYSGKIKIEDSIEGFASVSIENKLGIPLRAKEQYGLAWKRFLEIGELNANQIVLSLGENAYENRDIEQANKSLSDFMLFLRLAPKGMFEDLQEHYTKRLLLANELYLKYKEDGDIYVKPIPWDKIF
jgi:hypothetical protein